MRYSQPILMTVFLCSCATAPVQHRVESQRNFDAPPEKVWAGLMDYFTSNNIQIKTIEKDSGVIYAEQLYIGQDTAVDHIADCGKYTLEIPEQTNVSFNVFVREEKPVTVNVNASFSRVWRFGNYPPTKRSCTSKGTLEKYVLNHIHAYLMENM